jgi:pilus assembly protein CpaD
MKMTGIKTSAALLSLALASACVGPDDNRLTPAHNPSLSSVNQPVVQNTSYVLDLNIAGSGLSGSERVRLADWFESIALGYGDRVYVEQPGGYDDERSRQEIASIASQYGLLLRNGAPITAGSVQPGSVRVVVNRTTATVPGCPIWDELPVGSRVSTSENYGCAVNSNFAAMVADPNDLVLGQSSGIDRNGATGTRAIETYRKKAPTGAGALKAETK